MASAGHKPPASTPTLQYSSKEVKERMQELGSAVVELYPRYKSSRRSRTIRELLSEVDRNGGEEPVATVSSEWVEGKEKAYDNKLYIF